MITNSRKEEIRQMVVNAIRATRHWATSIQLVTQEEAEWARHIGSNFFPIYLLMIH